MGRKTLKKSKKLKPRRDPVRESVVTACIEGRVAQAWSEAWQVWRWWEPVPRFETRVVQCHYRPFLGARLLIEGTIHRPGKAPRRQDLFLQIFRENESARRRFVLSLRRKRPLRCHGPAVFGVPECRAIAWGLPNGPQLRNLRSYLHRKALGRTLQRVGDALGPDAGKWSRPRLIRYVPRRRALLYWERGGDDALYIKLYRKGDDVVAASNLGALQRADGLAFDAPRMVAHDEHRRAIFMKELPGVPFTERIAAAEPPEFAAVGRALGSLHASHVEASDRWSARGELASLKRALRDVRRVLPALRDEVRALRKRLRRGARHLEFPDDVPVHGNLFGDQILMDGCRVGIVDWDDLAVGDPLYDLGRLVAHVLFVSRREAADGARWAPCIDALLESYQQAVGTEVDGERLRWHVATALLMRAKISALRVLDEDWVSACRQSVDEARRILTEPAGAPLIEAPVLRAADLPDTWPELVPGPANGRTPSP